MKKTKVTTIFLVLSIALLAIPTSFAHSEESPYETPLLAGQTIPVGVVQVWNDGQNLYVKYLITEAGWAITETHLHLANEVSDFPTTKTGSPKVGHFEYSGEHDYETSVLYTIDLAEKGWSIEDKIYVAAHAVVETGGLMGICPILPDQVTVILQRYPPEALGYFTTIITGGTSLDGIHFGYCLEGHTPAIIGNSFTANVYCSYGYVPDGIIAYPENLDKVNWILNQNFLNETSPSDSVKYNYIEVQYAIWHLIEEPGNIPVVLPPGNPSYSETHINEILAAANANGDGYVPGSGDYVAIILDPVSGGQASLIKITVPYEQDETAWGAGSDFSGADWSMYFDYTIQ